MIRCIGMVVLAISAAAVPAADAASSDRRAPAPKRYVYDTPVQATSPWPEMRHDRRNTGRSPIRARYRGGRPWSYRTGKGIFSTPIIGGDGTVYVGSADSWFYALTPGGRLRWRFKTGNLIDSAATIGAYDRRLETAPVYVPSGDEHLYKLRTGNHRMSRKRRVIWRFKAQQPSGAAQLVNWWEGNVEIGLDGTLFAGNTGSAAYAINPDGTLKWQHAMGNSPWTAAARGDDGTTYWGSLDLNVYALDKDGKELWKTPTVGFVISSPALARDATLYIGSFDSNLYAIDARTGLIRWKFATGEHIYSSPALDEDATGRTRAIYVASVDGSVYALRPDGSLLWRYDTGDVVRSSPVLGRAPRGDGRIVYVGNGNGTVFALDAATGRRRWSYDTTSADPVLRDRNDLNASPALGATGVVIAGEDGRITSIPYDYCLHRRDRRCSTKPGEAFAPQMTRVFPVTAGGNTLRRDVARDISPAAILPTRLVVRDGGRTVDASMAPLPSANSLVEPGPAFDFSAHLSGDGHHLMVVPSGFLRPDTDYRVRLAGRYTRDGLPVGDVRLGGTGAGTFDDSIRFHTAPSRGPLPLKTSSRRVSAFELRRLAVPLPAFLPSVNQIGFDGYDFLVAPVRVAPPGPDGEGTLTAWVIAAKRLADGRTVPDPAGNFLFPLTGRYRQDSVILSASDVELTFSFGPVPLHLLQFRGQLGRNLSFLPGANLYVEANCADVPNYGPFLPLFRLCNTDGQLVSSGTFITRRYAGGRHAANARPPGVSVRSIELAPPSATADGSASAQLAVAAGTTYRPKHHTVGLLLTDAATGQPVALDYKKATRVTAGGDGNVAEVRVAIPARTQLPARVTAYVMTDVFPLAARDLPGGSGPSLPLPGVPPLPQVP